MVSEESVHPSPQSPAAFGSCGVAVEDQPGRPQGGRAVFGSPVLAFKFLAFGTVLLSLLFQPQAAAQSKGGLKASYTYVQQHLSHLFAVNVFNRGDRLYRNHSSFIKDLAPEIGRGIRFTYMVRFF